MNEKILQIVAADGRTLAVFAGDSKDSPEPKGSNWFTEPVAVWGLIERTGYERDPDDPEDEGSERFVDGIDPGNADYGRFSESANFIGYFPIEHIESQARWLEKEARRILEKQPPKPRT